MILTTYNLRSGGRPRIHWMKVLKEIQPNIFLVQETANPAEHLPPDDFSQIAERLIWNRVTGRHWGNALFVAKGEIRPISLPGFEGLVVGAEANGQRWPDQSHEPILIFSIHAPQRGSYQKSVHLILEMIAKIARDRPLIIGGDFNITVGIHPPRAARSTSSPDLAVIRRLEAEFGLLACWSSANAGRELGQTLRWSRNPETPYHCDGIFVPRTWIPNLTSCQILESEDWKALSDHNPVIARFR